MELFEGIRSDHREEGLSVRALARRHHVHRRTVRQALASAMPAAAGGAPAGGAGDGPLDRAHPGVAGGRPGRAAQAAPHRAADRLTYRAHVLETGSDSYRLRASKAKKGGPTKA